MYISPLYLGPPEMSKRLAPAPRPLNKMWLDTVITKKHERRRGHNASIWSVCLMLFTELKSLKQPDKITWSCEKTDQNADAISTKEYLYGAKCEVLMSVCNTCTSRTKSRSLYSVYYYIDETTDPLSMGVAPKKALKIKCFLDLQQPHIFFSKYLRDESV